MRVPRSSGSLPAVTERRRGPLGEERRFTEEPGMFKHIPTDQPIDTRGALLLRMGRIYSGYVTVSVRDTDTHVVVKTLVFLT